MAKSTPNSEPRLDAEPQALAPVSAETPSPALEAVGIPTETPEEAAIQTGEAAPEVNQQAIANEASKPVLETGTKKPRVAWNKGLKLGPGKTRPIESKLVNQPLLEQIAQVDEEACRVAAFASCDTFVLVARTVGGKEWGPDDDAELEALKQSWASTYVAYGWCKTPAWMPMVAGTAAYGMKRLNRPETAAKVQSLKEKIAVWWAKRQALKAVK